MKMPLNPFLFGKIPAHGDFVARGLTEAVASAWDDWASAELSAAREALGERFDAAYDAVPPWGFAAGPGAAEPGAADAGWRAGAIAASIDGAGRRFLVVAGYEGLAATTAGMLGSAIAADCETAIRKILSGALVADEAMDLLSRIAPDESRMALAAALDATPGAEGVWWSMAGLTGPRLGANPPAGLVSEALARTAAVLEEAV